MCVAGSDSLLLIEKQREQEEVKYGPSWSCFYCGWGQARDDDGELPLAGYNPRPLAP